MHVEGERGGGGKRSGGSGEGGRPFVLPVTFLAPQEPQITSFYPSEINSFRIPHNIKDILLLMGIISSLQPNDKDTDMYTRW